MNNLTPATEYAQFAGQWCDNCRTAYSYRPVSGNCPSCGTYPLVAANITVEVGPPRRIEPLSTGDQP